MIGLDKFKIKKESEDSSVGVFKISPLPRGYGYTLSNSLRRMLLSSIPGAAVTAIRINGVKHEYSTLDGLQEDVISLILKLKDVAIKSYSEEKRIIKLSVKGKKGKVLEIKAGDFELPSDVEIMNADIKIATLTNDVKLDLELIVETGIGYAYPKEELREELGTIPMDSFYSPVKRVQVEISKTRVGQDTDLDQIDMTIITNGTIKPSEALLKAVEIYDGIANRMVDLLGGDSALLKETSTFNKELEAREEKRILIGELNLSTRLNNALLNAGITNLNDLGKYQESEVIGFRGMGRKSLTELSEMMAMHEIKFLIKADSDE
jgi:DNA-directed RNA polymerase subunit alpha